MADNMTQEVSIAFGKVNLKTAVMTIAPMRVKAPFTRDSAVSTAKRDPYTMATFPVSNYPQVNGIMSRDKCRHPDGTILIIQSQWKRGGAGIRDGAVLLRLRENGPTLNVIAKLPHGLDSQLGDTFSVFMGRADILSPDEAKIFKIEIPNRFVQTFFDPEQVGECFTIEEVQPERSPPPTYALVNTSHGVEVRALATAPTRRMRIRRREE